MRFLITYDLIRPRKDYQPLWNALGRLGAERILESVWYLKGNYTAEQVSAHLNTVMDQDDLIFVARFDDWSGFIMGGVGTDLAA